MVRDFIKDRLYASNEGYFHRQEPQVGMLKEPIEFNKLLGYYAYRKELESKYPRNAWITPSEVFYPYFGYMIGNYIAEICGNGTQRFSQSGNNYSKFHIVEIGPGTGALAQSVIEYLSNTMFKSKMNFEYHGVEISSVLGDIIRKRFKDKHPKWLENGQLTIHNKSIFDYNHKSDVPGFVIGMEILDNMPHDRLYKDSHSIVDPWLYQTKVVKIETEEDEQEILEEHLEPIDDALGNLYLDLFQSLPSMDEIDIK